MQSYQIRSPLAMGGCLISASLSILLLVEPSFDGKFTIHTLVAVAVSAGLVSMAIIMGVLAHGHGLMSAAGAALALVSVGLSGAIVWEQSGRRAQTRIGTQTVVVDATKERARLTKLRAEADEILTGHRAAQARECASGKGKRCDGISYTVRTWEAALEGYDAKLRGVPAPTPDAKAESIGTAAELLGRDGKIARAWVTLIDPLLVPLLLELAAILCGVVAWGPRFPDAPHVTEIPTKPSVPSVPDQVGTLPESANSNAGTLGTPLVIVETDEARILEALAKRGGEIHSQRHLSIVLGISPAETCRMLKKCHPDRVERRWDPRTKSNVIRLRG